MFVALFVPDEAKDLQLQPIQSVSLCHEFEHCVCVCVYRRVYV